MCAHSHCAWCRWRQQAFTRQKIKEEKQWAWWDTWCVYCFLRNQNLLLGCYCVCVKSATERERAALNKLKLLQFTVLPSFHLLLLFSLSLFTFVSCLIVLFLSPHLMFLHIILSSLLTYRIFCLCQSTDSQTGV